MSSPVPLDTRTLFCAILKKLGVDGVYDIGSRDGAQTLFFRDYMPQARVAAFEANPDNYQAILAKNLERRGIEIYPYAISNQDGTAVFYVADPTVDPGAPGASSLHSGGYPVKRTVEVETHRLDSFTLAHYPDVRRWALWIDVESAEYGVLEGIEKILDRVLVIHVEVAIKPVRDGQIPLEGVTRLMTSYGFSLIGSSLEPDQVIGDVVYVADRAIKEMGPELAKYRLKAQLYRHLPISSTALYLRDHFRPLYSLLRRLYIKTT